MIFVALNEAAEKGELLLADGGLCRFHIRRDGVTVIREIIVLPPRRRSGVGRALVAEVLGRAPGVVVAKCPRDYEANAFWAALGFVKQGEKDAVNLWQRLARP